jgi:hypothetical protein
VDSLQSYESGHGDALCPIQREAERSFCGDHTLTNSVTALEVREFAASTDRKISTLMDTISIMMQKARSDNSRNSPIQPGTRHLDIPLDTQHVRPPLHHAHTKHPSTLISITPAKPLPLPNVHIPNIRRGPESWKEAIKQWEEDNAVTGFRALKDWPEEWFTGSQRLHFAAKRSQRRAISDEYKRYVNCSTLHPSDGTVGRFNRDDEAFKAAYPEATKGIKQLLQAITDARVARGEAIARISKNGKPYERLERRLPVPQA